MVEKIDVTQERLKAREKTRKAADLAERVFPECKVRFDEWVSVSKQGSPGPAVIYPRIDRMWLRDPRYEQKAEEYGRRYEDQIMGIGPNEKQGLMGFINNVLSLITGRHEEQFMVRRDYSDCGEDDDVNERDYR